MGLLEEFQKKVSENDWWEKEDNVLIAVSGGVDSVVLLNLMIHLESSLRPRLHVAHINHQLRDASDREESFVRDWCLKEGIPFFSTRWEKGPDIQSNLELEARKFRYAFFEKIMQEEQISMLLTGHHQGDQVETVLMRLIDGSRLNYLRGIEEKRPFSTGYLVRPLLLANKKSLYAYAKEENLLFYEDETNEGTAYFRNRLRHQIIPLLQEENPRVEEKILDFQKELRWGLELIEAGVRPKYLTCISFEGKECHIKQEKFASYSEAERHFVLNNLVSDLQDKLGLIISKKQQQIIEASLLSVKPNQQIVLKGDWHFVRAYETAYILEKKREEKKDAFFCVGLNQGCFLSETEWFGFFESEKMIIPEKIKKWSQKELIVMSKLPQPLCIRKRQPGDRLVLNKEGQSKKISRYFIDEKIPQRKREQSWIVADNEGQVKWLVPFRESYLSIRDETDKIHYKLVYLNKKDK